jgi:predicted transcriptional regulator
MLEKVLQLLSVICSHRKLSKPFTAGFDDGGKDADWMPVTSGPSHYVVCLECGKKFGYDWRHMRVVR